MAAGNVSAAIFRIDRDCTIGYSVFFLDIQFSQE
jgi:hypothetical protein